MKKQLLSDSDRQLLNMLIGKELFAETFYRAMANSMQFLGYFGCQKFFLSEAVNESAHYQKLVNFCSDMGILPELTPLSPLSNASGIKEAFTRAFDLEKQLGDEYQIAMRSSFDKNLYLFNILQSFVEEQRASIGEYGDFISQLDLCGNNESALLEFDEHIEDF